MKVFLAILLINSAQLIRVFKSTLPIETMHGSSRLHYSNQEKLKLENQSLSFCFQFNFKRILTTLFKLEDENMEYIILFASAKLPSWLTFHSPVGINEESRGSWILKDAKSNSYEHFFQVNRWHSICVSYNNFTGKLTVIKVLVVFCF